MFNSYEISRGGGQLRWLPTLAVYDIEVRLGLGQSPTADYIFSGL